MQSIVTAEATSEGSYQYMLVLVARVRAKDRDGPRFLRSLRILETRPVLTSLAIENIEGLDVLAREDQALERGNSKLQQRALRARLYAEEHKMRNAELQALLAEHDDDLDVRVAYVSTIDGLKVGKFYRNDRELFAGTPKGRWIEFTVAKVFKDKVE